MPAPNGQHLCETHASSFLLAAQFLPEEKRNAAYSIYGFCRATDQILDEKRSKTEKQKKLDEWKAVLGDEWNRIPTENSIVHDFIETCHSYSIPREWGFRLIDGLKRDLHPVRFETFDYLYAYCFSAASIPGVMMAHVFGAKKEGFEYAVSLGIAMQMTNILRDIKEDLEMNRVYLPLNELRMFHYTEIDLRHHVLNEDFKKFMHFQIERANEYYSHAQKGISFLDEDSQLCAQLCLSLYREILAEIEKCNYDVFSGRVRVPEWRKQELIQETQNQALSSLPLKT